MQGIYDQILSASHVNIVRSNTFAHRQIGWSTTMFLAVEHYEEIKAKILMIHFLISNKCLRRIVKTKRTGLAVPIVSEGLDK